MYRQILELYNIIINIIFIVVNVSDTLDML